MFAPDRLRGKHRGRKSERPLPSKAQHHERRQSGSEMLFTRTRRCQQKTVDQGPPQSALILHPSGPSVSAAPSAMACGRSLSLAGLLPRATADVLSLASRRCLCPALRLLALGIVRAPPSAFPFPSSVPCPHLLSLQLPKYVSSSDKLHIPQDPLKDSLFCKVFALSLNPIHLYSQGLSRHRINIC